MRPLKVGLYIPNGDGSMGGGTERWADVLKMATAAEDAGFDSVWVADHFIFKYDGWDPMGRWECWSLLSALAVATRRVEIGPLVNCMSFRNPALLAKIAETVDEISGGRLNVLVGAGWHQPEYEAFGFPFDHRVSRFEEGFTILRDLIKTGMSTFEGAYERTNSCEIRPRGPRPNGIPLIVGSNGPRMLKIMAEKSDGWNTTWVMSPEALKPLNAAVDAACDAAGRDPQSIHRSACVFVDTPRARGRGLPSIKDRPSVTGVEEIAELLNAYAAARMQHVMLWLDPNDLDGIETVGRALELLDTAI